MTKTCRTCGKEFEASGNAKTCSQECSGRPWKKRQPAIGNCIICGREFQKRSNSATTCGTECRRESLRRYMHDFWRLPERRQKELERSRRRQAEREPTRANCAICGAEYVKLGANKTCGPDCRARFERAGTRERGARRARATPIIANCVICGSEFRKFARGMTCSLDCRAVLDQSRRRTNSLRPGALEKHRERTRRDREARRIIIPCAECGKPFTKMNRSPCCSLECREQYLEHRRSSRKRGGNDEGIAPFPDDIDREGFGYYLSGFADGEASFQLVLAGTRGGTKHPRASFTITLRDDDIDVLRLIHSYWRCGTIHFSDNTRSEIINAKPVARYTVTSSTELIRVVIPHFLRFPLHAKKRRDFEVWHQGVELLAEVNARPLKYRPGHAANRHGGAYPKWTETDRERFTALRTTLREQRQYVDRAASADSVGEESPTESVHQESRNGNGWLFE